MILQKLSITISAKALALILAAATVLILAAVSSVQPIKASAADRVDVCAGAQLTDQRADCTKIQNCPTGKNCNESFTNLPQVNAGPGQVTNALKIVFGVAAAVALISLGIAAFNFATAQTDAEKISRSKKAILFSLLGLIIALSAEAIVLTVLDRL
jgi:hypothetical protein